jgi:transposase
MPRFNNLSRCRSALVQDSTIIAVVEMSQASRLVAVRVRGVDRHPLKKLGPDKKGLLRLLRHWQGEAVQAGGTITRGRRGGQP